MYERVSDKLNENSFALMQDKTHMNKVVGNFTSKFDGIKKCMKAETKVDLNSGFFNLDSKGSSISILNKVPNFIFIYLRCFLVLSDLNIKFHNNLVEIQYI